MLAFFHARLLAIVRLRECSRTDYRAMRERLGAAARPVRKARLAIMPEVFHLAAPAFHAWLASREMRHPASRTQLLRERS
jgi:hypothetical protein